jgi:hypothetical protein
VIDANLEASDVILLLVSPEFLASHYCFDIEMARAMEKYEARTARVIPIILRSCEWRESRLGKLLAAPKDGKPIDRWTNIDEAFLDVATSIRKAVVEVNAKRSSAIASPPGRAPTAISAMPSNSAPKQPNSLTGQASTAISSVSSVVSPRSSNLRITKAFTDHDRDTFMRSAFELMVRFFKNSMDELVARNPDTKAEFTQIDAHRFQATIYREGKAVARSKVWFGNPHGSGGSNSIFYSGGTYGPDNSYNESLSIGDDKQILFLRATMQSPARYGISADKLSDEGAAEYYWAMFIEPLQR